MTPTLFAVFWLAAGSAPAACPDVSPEPAATPYDASRVWLHEPGWFVPLDDPAKEPAKTQRYAADASFLTVTEGGETVAYPIQAMAYHHVANDLVGGVPVVVTF